jgi:PTS system mannose-specific IIA component
MINDTHPGTKIALYTLETRSNDTDIEARCGMETSIVVVTHGEWGQELVRAAEGVLGRQDNLLAVSLAFNESPTLLEERLDQALDDLGGPEKILFLADLKGGTPWNSVLKLCRRGNVSCVSGVNLPMLIELLTRGRGMTPDELVALAVEAGKQGITELKNVLKETGSKLGAGTEVKA